MPRLVISEAFVFGTLSVLRSWKGHLYVLEALKSLIDAGHPAYLLIVGEGPYREVIAERIAALDLAERVRLVGDQEQVADWLALMDALVMASYAHEGVPQAVLGDNARALVLDRDPGTGHVRFNPAYLQFCRDWSVTPRACGPYRARTKGKVEAGVKYDYGVGVPASNPEADEHFRAAGLLRRLPCDDPLSGQCSYLPRLRQTRQHGSIFYYKCCDTAVLAWA